MDENKELSLEEIMREFGSAPMEDPEEIVFQNGAEEPEALETEESSAREDLEQTRKFTVDLEGIKPVSVNMDQTQRIGEDLQATRRIDPVELKKEKTEVTGDTVRLDGLRQKITQRIPEIAPEENPEERIWTPGDTIHSEPFSKNWEPEYDQPMGEYVPPQPIQFQPRSRFRELKKKLVAGPEKRYYELWEKGVGKLQAAIFLSVLVALICGGSTVMYALGLVQDNRLRLMVFGQFLAMLVSALLGSYQLIEGITDLFEKRFTLNTLLAVTFLFCCVDGVVCLSQVRVPCCAAFSLEVCMSLWSTYHRRSREISQMDTMRKATRLDGVAACPDYMGGKKGLLRTEGQVEDFMDTYDETGKPEKRLQTYGLVATFVAFAIGIFAGVTAGVAAGVQVTAVSLLAAVPATAFITHSRPAWLLETRLHKLGTVLCGWQGVEGLSGKAAFPLTFQDLYPMDAVRLNGVKYFGTREPDQVVAYATAVIGADNCGLSPLFHQVLDTYNGRHYDATDLTHYENGGLGGVVQGESVLIGSASFLRDMDITVPENAKVSYGVYVAIEGELCGLFAVSYEKTTSATAGLTTLNAYRRLNPVLVSDDFMLTAGFIRSKFGIKPKRLLMPQFPERGQLRQKELPEETRSLLMTTSLGLAPIAYGVTGARALRTTSRLGTVLHIVGGGVGLAIMALLAGLSALELLTPMNVFLFQLIWMIPGLLFTEWTRAV